MVEYDVILSDLTLNWGKETILRCLTSPRLAFDFIQEHKIGRCKEIEAAIVKDPTWALQYARFVIKGRWPEAEPHIAKNARCACCYADEIIKHRWIEAEKHIGGKGGVAYSYVKRFEDEIMQDLANPDHKLTNIDRIAIKMIAKYG